MKRVLVVDDDDSFLHSLIEGFKSFKKRFSITTASDGLEAVAILKEQEINLVLTDLKMPGMDGFELVAHLNNKYPEIPIIVMTAFGTPEMENDLEEMGAYQYIEKPIDFEMLVEKLISCLESSSKGYVTGVSISSFLQLLEWDKKTCTLSITAGANKGTMFFRNGVLLDATTHNQRGSSAAHTIVNLENVTIEINNSCSVTKRNISEPIGLILLENTRRRDEINAADCSKTDTRKSDLALDSSNRETLTLVNDNATSSVPLTSRTPVPHQFVELLNSLTDIISATITDRSGRVLHQAGEQHANTADFISYVAISAAQIGSHLGATGQLQTIFTLEDNSKLLVFCSQELILGIRINNNTLPSSITKKVLSVLNKIRFQDN